MNFSKLCYMNTQCTSYTRSDLIESYCLHKHAYIAVLPSLSESPVSFEGFIICFRHSHERISVFTNLKPWQQQERRKHTSFQFLPVAFNHNLEALNVTQSNLHYILFSCTRIKVNYISLLTGMALWKEVQFLGCWAFILLLRANP